MTKIVEHPRDSAPAAPRFLDQVWQAALAHYNRMEPAQRCVDWARRFILFHHKRHPSEMGAAEVGAFLQHVANTDGLPRIVDELENAREALEFVYEHVVHRPLGVIAVPQPPAYWIGCGRRCACGIIRRARRNVTWPGPRSTFVSTDCVIPKKWAHPR